MIIRPRTPLVVLACLLAPSFAEAQHADHEDAEVIQKPAVPPKPPAHLPDVARVAEQIVRRTNAFRARHGQKPVKANAKLGEAARYFAGYMGRTDRYGHYADGGRPSDRARKHGYDYCIILENIAYQYRSAGFTTDELAGRFVKAWEDSPPHRRNMLDPDVVDTGVGVARSKDTGYFYAVQVFGRPQSQAVKFRVANDSDSEVEYRVGGRSYTLPPRYARTHRACRPPEVKFEWPEGEGEPKAVRPRGGESYLVLKEGGRFRVKEGRTK
jgi:uncharacterized protein YkwD